MGIKEIIHGVLEKKKRYKEMEADNRAVERIQEKKKSANERELERYLAEEREKQIKVQLENFRKKRKKEANKNQFAHNKYLFKDEGGKGWLRNDMFSKQDLFK